MLHNKLYTYCLAVAAALMLTACESFLSELPDKGANQPVTTVEQLNGLLDGFSSDESNAAVAFATDDNYLPTDIYNASSRSFNTRDLYHYTFNTADLPNESSDALWSSLYADIYKANLILENADKVSGDATLKARVRAEAHFLRAYNYWVLANYYCLPYAAANMQEQGLPRKLSTNDEENYTQMTLAQTYELIDADITEALKVDIENSQNTWRADRATVNAFLSRYYLFRGEYEKAVTAANYALEHRGITNLRDYNTLTAGTPYISGEDTIHHSELSNSLAQDEIANWEEFYYVRFAYVSQNIFPSQALLDLYTEGANDMRFKWFMHPKGNLRWDVNVQMWWYSMFSDGRYAWSGPTIQEVMLNKAEALLRQSTADVNGALSVVNELRGKRIAPGTPGLALSAGTKEEALTKVLQERRRELPFGFRWWDIRRFAVNETTADDVTVTHTFYPVGNGKVDNKVPVVNYTLPVGSRRYAIPINATEILYSQGKIKQNTYQ